VFQEPRIFGDGVHQTDLFMFPLAFSDFQRVASSIVRRIRAIEEHCNLLEWFDRGIRRNTLFKRACGGFAGFGLGFFDVRGDPILRRVLLHEPLWNGLSLGVKARLINGAFLYNEHVGGGKV
jgi:hypothetical protein